MKEPETYTAARWLKEACDCLEEINVELTSENIAFLSDLQKLKKKAQYMLDWAEEDSL